MAAAERKKQQVRDEIQQLRQEFHDLIQQNLRYDPVCVCAAYHHTNDRVAHSLPTSEQLPRESFELDPELRAKLELEAQQKVTLYSVRRAIDPHVLI